MRLIYSNIAAMNVITEEEKAHLRKKFKNQTLQLPCMIFVLIKCMPRTLIA